jgi:hypothetical protein
VRPGVPQAVFIEVRFHGDCTAFLVVDGAYVGLPGALARRQGQAERNDGEEGDWTHVERGEAHASVGIAVAG